MTSKGQVNCFSVSMVQMSMIWMYISCPLMQLFDVPSLRNIGNLNNSLSLPLPFLQTVVAVWYGHWFHPKVQTWQLQVFWMNLASCSFFSQGKITTFVFVYRLFYAFDYIIFCLTFLKYHLTKIMHNVIIYTMSSNNELNIYVGF